jgi:protein-S-isoprenylcysteine O-methyltransferase Ste14
MNQRLLLTRALLIPVVMLAIFSHHVYPEDSAWDRLLAVSGLLFLLMAMGGRIWASAYIAGKKDLTLVTEGPYRLTRNPLYFFSLLGFVGAGLAFGSLALAGLFSLVFLLSHLPAIRGEEVKLRNLFGEDYEEYARSVPPIFPTVRSFRERVRTTDKLVIDAPRFASALRDCLAIPMVFVIADLLDWAKLAEVVPVVITLP